MEVFKGTRFNAITLLISLSYTQLNTNGFSLFILLAETKVRDSRGYGRNITASWIAIPPSLYTGEEVYFALHPAIEFLGSTLNPLLKSLNEFTIIPKYYDSNRSHRCRRRDRAKLYPLVRCSLVYRHSPETLPKIMCLGKFVACLVGVRIRSQISFFSLGKYFKKFITHKISPVRRPHLCRAS